MDSFGVGQAAVAAGYIQSLAAPLGKFAVVVVAAAVAGSHRIAAAAVEPCPRQNGWVVGC